MFDIEELRTQERVYLTPANEWDADAVLALYRTEKARLGIDASGVWYRYWHSNARLQGREQWTLAMLRGKEEGEQPTLLGFTHYCTRLDGVTRWDEIAVIPAARHMGIGALLLRAVPVPCLGKADIDNTISNNFLLKHGMRCVGQKYSKDGKRLINMYERWEPWE